jgi:mannose-1-phosphate guanylyltransferase
LLEWTFERLAQNGVDEVILAVSRQTEFYLKQHRLAKSGLTIKYSHDLPKMPLGTAGPIKKAEKLIGNTEPFLVLNGDIFADLNYKKIFDSHIEGRALATIALHEVEDPSRYGVAELASENLIKKFIEKPTKETAPTNLINAGAYVLSPKIFDYIPSGRAVSIERDVFPKLAEKNLLYGHKIDGLWIDIGNPKEFLQTNMILLGTIATAKKTKHNQKFELKHPVAIAKGVSICENSIIGPNTILGKNVSVGKNVQITDSVIFSDTTIGDDTVISGTLIGECVIIGKNVKITDGCIIGDQAKIKDNVALLEKVSVCPAKEVSENILKSRNIC